MVNIETLRRRAAIAVVAVLALWWVSSGVVMAIRHPWMTQREHLVYLWTSLTFGSVDYDEVRPR